MFYQLIAKLVNLPCQNEAERDTLLSIIEHLNVRIEQLEDKVIELEREITTDNDIISGKVRMP